jgi:hypothetical protein
LLGLNLRFKNRKVKNKNPEIYLYCQLLLKQLLRRDISKINLGKLEVCNAGAQIQFDKNHTFAIRRDSGHFRNHCCIHFGGFLRKKHQVQFQLPW